VFRLSAAVVLTVFSWSAPNGFTPDLKMQEQTKNNIPGPAFPTPLTTLLDLQEPPPANAYAITGHYLPPFLQAVLGAWQREFPNTPLSANNIIFVIRPADFYTDLNPQQENWLASREMLGIQNFPLIINPLTPGDDWYLRAQQEWKRGNDDAIYVLLTSLLHEITHTRFSGDEPAAYKDQLALFERFRKQGKLASPYAHACHKSLISRYADLRRHPEQYVQVQVRFQRQTIALLVRSKTSTTSLPPRHPY
jgi:hypothetical protein